MRQDLLQEKLPHYPSQSSHIYIEDLYLEFTSFLWHWAPAGPTQSGALSLVGIVEAWLSLVESFIELKYFHDVATPALLCHKEACRIQSPVIQNTPMHPCFHERKGPIIGAGSLWHKRAGVAMISDNSAALWTHWSCRRRETTPLYTAQQQLVVIFNL